MRGPRTVLRGLDFTVPRGRITGLLGPSGCGKSTLMRATVGTQAKVEGTLEVLGRPAGDPTLRSRIGYVTQAPSVYDDLTVRQNLDYFAAILDPGRAAAERRHADVTRAITDVDLTSHADALAGTLSGGQRQSVAIARAVHFGARVLILDEPTAALGVKQSGVVLKYIAAARERGLGVIFITHNPHHAYMVGDHFSVLRLGTLELSAARSEVSLEDLTHHMAGGVELAALKHELAQVSG
ncbi:ABC transporter ATP-binding protein, partial [Streptomyces sp. NPDC127574]|uniref:ABC transporter ATP-binding protein n=1 Tax=Streptomyces sp. NPDC127574 TaxID=3345401 RepID=UPI003636B06C